MARKKRKEDSPKGAPFWMTTYGDMITLVLTFFILLYSYSSLDVLKWKQVVSSVKGSLGVIDGGTTLNDIELVGQGKPNDNINERRITEEELEQFERLQQKLLEMENLKNSLKGVLEKMDQRIIVDTDQRGVILRFEDSVLFDKGKADLKPEARDVLTKVADLLIELDKPIRIEGHTDDLPIRTVQFPSNWELSTTRSTNVLRFLLEHGLNPKQLSAVGYGEYHPLVPNIDEESRRKNRRVDIVILRDSIALQEPNGNGG
ncbi:MAG: chemotaxis protein MotB [Clostridia bacterium]|jgi:chemotaxis protein MotB|nr:chemotaxis protein MotB [Clostridia bacterium]MDN5322939.1 chemotaxis protein MotB [Clostridia bacterium]